MIIDTSAIVAIIMMEEGYERVLDTLTGDQRPGIAAPTLVETAIVLSARMGSDVRSLLTRFLHEAGVVLIPFGDSHYSTAVEAWLRYGKGRHPARLNFGDCLTYAAAKLANQPLLCVGDDFAKTDLLLA